MFKVISNITCAHTHTQTHTKTHFFECVLKYFVEKYKVDCYHTSVKFIKQGVLKQLVYHGIPIK